MGFEAMGEVLAPDGRCRRRWREVETAPDGTRPSACAPWRLGGQAVTPADGELAIRMEPPPPPDRPLSGLSGDEDTRSPAASAAAVPGRWLALVGAFARRIAPAAGDLGSPLGEMLEELGGEGACALEWAGEGDPLVLAARGAVGSLPRRSAFGPGVGGSGRVVGEGMVGALGAADDRTVAVIVWGRFPSRHRVEPLLATLAGLIAERGQPPPAPVAPRPPELPFAADYVPGRSPAMEELYGGLRRMASRSDPLLVVGETGVGKERIARLLHRASPRRRGPWVAVNCAAIPADLLEAEMFGISANVATGVTARRGRFREADGGTLFLDEIGEMPPALQVKLLRALEEGEVQTVGGPVRRVDVRIVAATNADLGGRMGDGSFRRDLYYRLAAAVLEVPPLRERPEDLPELVEVFLLRRADALGRRPLGLTAKALGHLTAYPWPGNVRELAHEVGRLLDRCPDGRPIDSSMLSPHVLATGPEGPVGRLGLDERVAALERRLIREALDRSGGRLTAAARILGITRFRLARKIERLGLDGS